MTVARLAAPARRTRERPSASLDPVSLSVSVWVRLLKAESLMTRALRRGLPQGLTQPQFDVLAQLHRHERADDSESRGLTPSALTRSLLVTGGNVTVIVARLTRDGLVERRRGEEDRRTVRLRLSPQGRALVERELPRYRAAVAALLAPLPVEARRRLRELLGRLSAALESGR